MITSSLRVSLKGSEGNVVTVIVRGPKNLQKVKVGDKLAITYAEALATSVAETVRRPDSAADACLPVGRVAFQHPA